ncbi:MAG TPA: TRAP transporter small permease [Syntrophorhabdales bacterium]|nr:TRAP transporter small permease [Syntrophorhabdales bacterium]
MDAVLACIEKLSKWMQAVSCVALTCLMLLTTIDVIGRTFGHPIIGTYELVGLGGAVVLGFAIPITSWIRGHIAVDTFYRGFSKPVQNGFNVATRLISMVLFVLIGWNLFKLGYELHTAGEVTFTRHLPFYPVAYGLAICCFVQCVILLCDIVKIARGKYE